MHVYTYSVLRGALAALCILGCAASPRCNKCENKGYQPQDQGGDEDYYEEVVVGDPEPEERRCYACLEHNARCRYGQLDSRVDSTTCQGQDKFCMIEEVLKNDEVLTFKRSCSAGCVTGCESVGSALTYTKCVTCCSGSMCNGGRAGGSTVAPRTATLLLGLLLTAALRRAL